MRCKSKTIFLFETITASYHKVFIDILTFLGGKGEWLNPFISIIINCNNRSITLDSVTSLYIHFFSHFFVSLYEISERQKYQKYHSIKNHYRKYRSNSIFTVNTRWLWDEFFKASTELGTEIDQLISSLTWIFLKHFRYSSSNHVGLR